MPDQDRDSKTEEATPYKREKLRQKGQVAQSKEINTSLILLAGSIFFYFYGKTFFTELGNILKTTFLRIEKFPLTDANLVYLLMEALKVLLALLAPMFIVIMAIGVLTNVAQTGFIFSSETLKFNFEKLNPIPGLRRMFSVHTLIETTKVLIKFTIITVIVYTIVKGEIEGSIVLMDQSIGDILKFIGKAIFKTCLYVGFLMIILAVIDFLYQKIKFERDIRMTKQEVKEELKDREGDPRVKARIRSLQRQAATKRMMQEVPKASVVVTNPTHLAIAIQYSKELAAPKVLAKGADFIAEKIRNIAKEHDIPLVENKPLAQTLYKQVKVGQFIPQNLYQAVAEVLAYVMRIKNNMREVMGMNSNKGAVDAAEI